MERRFRSIQARVLRLLMSAPQVLHGLGGFGLEVVKYIDADE